MKEKIYYYINSCAPSQKVKYNRQLLNYIMSIYLSFLGIMITLQDNKGVVNIQGELSK